MIFDAAPAALYGAMAAFGARPADFAAGASRAGPGTRTVAAGRNYANECQ